MFKMFNKLDKKRVKYKVFFKSGSDCVVVLLFAKDLRTHVCGRLKIALICHLVDFSKILV